MVSIMVTSIFLELGRMVDIITQLNTDGAIETEAVHENGLDNVFQKLFKARSFHVCWQVLNCVFLILFLL